MINTITGGRRGAILLNLIDDQPHSDTLTHLDAEVVRFARDQHGTVTAALAESDTWTGHPTRFTEFALRWAQLARSLVAKPCVTELRKMETNAELNDAAQTTIWQHLSQ